MRNSLIFLSITVFVLASCDKFERAAYVSPVTATGTFIPIQLPSLGNNVLQIASGATHTCAIVRGSGGDQLAYCWGSNSFGELGNGGNNPSPYPVQAGVGILKKVVAISAGNNFTCAIDSSATDAAAQGAVYCWGNNARSQLGLGAAKAGAVAITSTNKPQPVVGFSGGTATLTQASVIKANNSRACATVGANSYCWGNTIVQVSSPITVNGATTPGWKAQPSIQVTPTLMVTNTGGITTGVTSYALLQNDTCVSDGNDASCLGQNIGNAIASSSQISGGSSLGCSIVAGRLAVTCWTSSPTADATAAPTVTPTTTNLLYSPGSLDSNYDHTCAVISQVGTTAPGAVYCWGNNDGGQLGIGNVTVPILFPTVAQVAPNTQFLSISTGQNHTCGVAYDNSAWCWGSNNSGQLGLASPPS